MRKEVFLAEDDTVPLEGLQIGLLLGEGKARVVFDAEYTGITEAFLAQGVALSIIRDNQDAVIIHHSQSPLVDEFHAWWEKHEV